MCLSVGRAREVTVGRTQGHGTVDSYKEKETSHSVVLFLEKNRAIYMCKSRASQIDRFTTASAQLQGNCLQSSKVKSTNQLVADAKTWLMSCFRSVSTTSGFTPTPSAG